VPATTLSQAAAHAVHPGGEDVPDDTWARLERIPDPRNPRGRRYPLPSLIAIALCALTAAGHDQLCAIGQWIARATQTDLARLRIPADPLTGRRTPPAECTVRRLLARVTPDKLTHLLAPPSPAVTTSSPDEPLPVWALDGKSCRGARTPDGRRTHLLGVIDQHTGDLLAQCVVDGKHNETSAFASC
jgi:hypothetical protein